MPNIPTPHIDARENEIAKTVLLAGDPNRATLMAKKFLKKCKLVNNIRGNVCYSGLYNGKAVSIMSCGMGSGSMGIYSYELYNFYGVENIIRVGTAGSLKNDATIGDIVVAKSVTTDTNLYKLANKNGGETTFLASKKLLKTLESLPKTSTKMLYGKVYSTDTFYSDNKDTLRSGAICVEMETGALYATARKYKKNAIALLTISDEILTGKKLTAKERECRVISMFEIALNIGTNC